MSGPRRSKTRPWKVYTGLWVSPYPDTWFHSAFATREGAERRARKLHEASVRGSKPLLSPVAVRYEQDGVSRLVLRLSMDDNRKPVEERFDV